MRIYLLFYFPIVGPIPKCELKIKKKNKNLKKIFSIHLMNYTLNNYSERQKKLYIKNKYINDCYFYLKIVKIVNF